MNNVLHVLQCQLSMAEIVCVTSSSEPGAPKISIYTRESAVKNESPLRLLFVSDNDHDEWMAYLSYGELSNVGLISWF